MAGPSSRTVIIAGAGIGGLTAALALARNGFRALILEQAERLEETGAGIQLSPNAATDAFRLHAFEAVEDDQVRLSIGQGYLEPFEPPASFITWLLFEVLTRCPEKRFSLLIFVK